MNGQPSPWEWRERSVPLLFAAGTRTLWAPRLDVLVHEWALPQLLSAKASPLLVLEPLPGNLDGFDVRSQPLWDGARPEERVGAYIRYIVSEFDRCYIDLKIGWDEYRSRFSSKSRSTIRRKIRKFEERCDHPLDVRAYRTVNEIREFMTHASSLSRATYQEQRLDVGLPREQEDLRRFEQMAGENRLRGFLLFHREKPVAYMLTPAWESVLLYEYQGYDPEFAAWSPGTLLMWRVLEILMEERVFDLFDFTEGAGEHKRFFASGRVPCGNVLLLRSTLRNRLLVRSHRLFRTLKRVAKRK